MKLFLIAMGLLAIAYGGMVVVKAESAVHEIEYLICFLTAAVLIGAAGICETVENTAKLKPKPKEAAPS
jgi:hypothetical protein